jgi:hypothetical protein
MAGLLATLPYTERSNPSPSNGESAANPTREADLFEIIRTTRFDAALKQTRFRTNWPARRQQQSIRRAA